MDKLQFLVLIWLYGLDAFSFDQANSDKPMPGRSFAPEQQHPFNGLFSRTTWVSWYQKGKTSLDLNEARDYGVLGCSSISWIIYKQSAPRSRQISTPTPHHLQAGCSSWRPANSVKARKAELQ